MTHDSDTKSSRSAAVGAVAEADRLRGALQDILAAHANDNHRPKAFYIASKALDAASPVVAAALPEQDDDDPQAGPDLADGPPHLLPRFYHDHGVVHDRKTGRHVCTAGHPDTSLDEVVGLLNSLTLPEQQQQTSEGASLGPAGAQADGAAIQSEEGDEGEPYECRRCNGTGIVEGSQVEFGGAREEVCYVCRGSGKNPWHDAPCESAKEGGR